MSYGHSADLLYEEERRRRQERNAVRASDYEDNQDGEVRIYFGHPCYCRQAQIPKPWPASFPGPPKKRETHTPHTYRYVHLTDDGPMWEEYECNGEPLLLPVKQ